MHSLQELAQTVLEETQAIGGNTHPMPVSITMERSGSEFIWAVCISVRNDRYEFTAEAEHCELPQAMKNALRGIRAEIGRTIKRTEPTAFPNKVQRSPNPENRPAWNQESHDFMLVLNGESHSRQHRRNEPGDIGYNGSKLMETIRGD